MSHVHRNESDAERTVRVGVGLVLLLSTFMGPCTAWGWLGVIPLMTGIFGVCPFYTLSRKHRHG